MLRSVVRSDAGIEVVKINQSHSRTPVRRCEAQATLKCFSCHAVTDRNQRLLVCGLDFTSKHEDVCDQVLRYLFSDPARALNAHGLAVFMLFPNNSSRIRLPTGSRLPVVHNTSQLLGYRAILLLSISSLCGRLRPLSASALPTGQLSVEGEERVRTRSAADENLPPTREITLSAVAASFCDMDVSEPSSPTEWSPYDRSSLSPRQYSPLIPSKWPCPPPSVSLPALPSPFSPESLAPPFRGALSHSPPPLRALPLLSAAGGPPPPASISLALSTSEELPNQVPRFDAGLLPSTISSLPLLDSGPVVFQNSRTQTLHVQGKPNSPTKKRHRSLATKARQLQATVGGISRVSSAKHPKKPRTSSAGGGVGRTTTTPRSQSSLLTYLEEKALNPTVPLLFSPPVPSCPQPFSYAVPAAGRGQPCVTTTLTPPHYGNHIPPLLPWPGPPPHFPTPPASSWQPDPQPRHRSLGEVAFTDQCFTPSSPTLTLGALSPPRPTWPPQLLYHVVDQPPAIHNAFLMLPPQTELSDRILFQPPSTGFPAVCPPTSEPQFLSPAYNESPLMSYPAFSCPPLQLSAVRMSDGVGVNSAETSHDYLSNRLPIASHVRYSQPPPLMVPKRASAYSSKLSKADGMHCLPFQPIDAASVTAPSSLGWVEPQGRSVAIAGHSLAPSSVSLVRGAAPTWSAPPLRPPLPTQWLPSCSLPQQNVSPVLSPPSESPWHHSQRLPLNSAGTTAAVTARPPIWLMEPTGVTPILPQLPHPGSIPDCRMGRYRGPVYPTLSGAQRLQPRVFPPTDNLFDTAQKAVLHPCVTRDTSSAPTVTSPHVFSLAGRQEAQSHDWASSALQTHKVQPQPLSSGNNYCPEVALTWFRPATMPVAPQSALSLGMSAGVTLGQGPPHANPPSRLQQALHELGTPQPLLPVGQLQRDRKHAAHAKEPRPASKLMTALLAADGPQGDSPCPIICPLCPFADTSREAVFTHFASVHLASKSVRNGT
ncbi:unnamed protein product [Schistocephalus solidus]|uniref:C2H2-type domain-containing protein n=1 Tax=Schistocephalus solidus TaxID=70667 RepID=A0A183SWU3_SCHSO|nr:unnamed protein product [Schistocephalus solidus]